MLARATEGAFRPRLFALLLIGAVGCSSSHHHSGDGGDEETDASFEGDASSRDARADTGLPGRDSGGPVDGSFTLDASNDDGGPSLADGGPGADGGTGTLASATALNFGLQACGGAAPAAQTLSLTNPGSSPLNYTATLSATTAFTLAGATNGVLTGQLAGGASITLTLNAASVAASATAGQAITASLDITTDAAAPNAHLSIPVTIVPQGATLAVVPAGTPSASFGIVPFNATASTLPIKLQNTGNIAAQVTLTQPTIMQFSVLSGTSAASALTVPAATGTTPGSIDLTASFAPTFVGPLASSAALSVAAPVCNGGTASATQISLEGTGTGTGFVASTTTPLAALVNCGTTGEALPAATISVGNFTPAVLTFTATLLSGASSPFALSASSGSVNSQATGTLTARLLASAVPQTATPGTVLSDTVVLTPTSGTGLSPIQLPISTTVQGSVLSFGTATAFNSASNAAPQAQLLTISNVGNLAASPTLSTAGTDASLFTITGALTPAAIPGGSVASPGQGAVTVSFTPPVGDAATKNATLVITPGANDVICAAAAPAPLALTGTAATPGFRLDTPSNGTLPFGNAGFVACPAGNSGMSPGVLPAAGVHHVRFTNTGSSTLTWSATLAGGTSLFTADVLTGTLLAGQQAAIALTPKPIPYPADTSTDAYSDVLTVTTDIVNDQPHLVSLSQTAQGAVVAASATSSNFGLVHSGLTSPLNPAFNLQNTGNAGINLTITSTPTAHAPSGFVPTSGYPQYTFNGITNGPVPIALAANSTSAVNGLFAPGPAAGDAFTSSVVEAFVSDASPLCAPLPASLSFAGTGTAAVVTYSSTGVSFPSGVTSTGCGDTATPITVVVSNTGNQDFAITGLELGGDHPEQFSAYIGAFNVVTATVPAANNGTPGTAAITVAPKQVPADNHGVQYRATLTVPYQITGDAPGSQTITIIEDTHCP